MKLSTKTPWMPVDEYGRSLRGLTLNLLVRKVEAAVTFQRRVLGAEVVYEDPDFAMLRHGEAEWMLHADHTYDKHALFPHLQGNGPRGIGAELRLHRCDPDKAVAEARGLGCEIVSPATDKPHGVREAFILDQDGYLWVPDTPLPPKA